MANGSLAGDSLLRDLTLTLPDWEEPALLASSGKVAALGTILEYPSVEVAAPIPWSRLDHDFTLSVHAHSMEPGKCGLSHRGLAEDSGFLLHGDGVSNPTMELPAVTEFKMQTLLPDAGGAAGGALVSEQIEHWTLARAELRGHSEIEVYEEIPDLILILRDLHPESFTYVHAYKGLPRSTSRSIPLVCWWQLDIIRASWVEVNDTVPQDRVVLLTDLDMYFTRNGVHTLEVVHETPFGTEILFQSIIQVRRPIFFRPHHGEE